MGERPGIFLIERIKVGGAIKIKIGQGKTHRNPKISPQETQGGQAAEKEAQLAPKVALVRIDHVGDGDRHDDARGGLDSGGERDGLAPDPGSGALAQDHETDRSDGEVVEEVPDQHQRGLGPDDTLVVRVAGDTVQDPDEQLQECQQGQAVVVDGASSQVHQQQPGEQGTHESHRQEADAHVERFGGGEAGFCFGGFTALVCDNGTTFLNGVV